MREHARRSRAAERSAGMRAGPHGSEGERSGERSEPEHRPEIPPRRSRGAGDEHGNATLLARSEPPRAGSPCPPWALPTLSPGPPWALRKRSLIDPNIRRPSGRFPEPRRSFRAVRIVDGCLRLPCSLGPFGPGLRPVRSRAWPPRCARAGSPVDARVRLRLTAALSLRPVRASPETRAARGGSLSLACSSLRSSRLALRARLPSAEGVGGAICAGRQWSSTPRSPTGSAHTCPFDPRRPAASGHTCPFDPRRPAASGHTCPFDPRGRDPI